MKFSGIVTAIAATSLAAMPIASLAASQPTPVRESSLVEDSEQLRGGSWVIPLLAIAAVILGILAATSGDGDRPTSP